VTVSNPIVLSDPRSASHVFRFPILDLARFVAALLVVFFHWCFLFNIADPAVHYKPWLELEPYARYGYLGVNLFFLISGFLIVQSAYLKTPGHFLRARVTRLYPAYLACCVLTYGVISLTASRAISASSFAYNMTMMNGVIDSFRGEPATYVDGVYWTLVIEWKFYALTFLLVAAGQLDRIERFLWLWLLACLVYAIHPVQWLDTYLIAAWGAYFIGGAAFFRACAAGWNLSRMGLVLASLGLCIAQALQFAAELSAVHGRLFRPVVVACLIASFFVFFATLSLRGPFMRRAIPRWIVALGALSYPIYLLHQQIGAIVIQQYWSANTRYVLLALAFVGLLALAAAVHFGIERRIWAVLCARSAIVLPAGRGIT
jgi:peptidoglycan/LPS O-acetylase OafA/YrhL